MNILLLAPQPFYQDRGTPLAVDLVLKVLTQRGEQVDVVAYHEGKDVMYDHATIHRILNFPFIHHVRPGFSWKKIICDLLMVFKVVQLLSKKKYHVIHAVEESVFIAMLINWILKIPYVYDMDSSLSQQMTERFPLLRSFDIVLSFFEKIAVRHAKAVVPVCDALHGVIERYKPEKVVVLRDVSLLEELAHQKPANLKAELDIDDLIVMYVGNLEAYQGISLLLESFALVLHKTAQADLVIIGGQAADVRTYQQQAAQLGIHQKVHFLGPQPISRLGGYLTAADILVSPRIKGHNTPMKLYSYLHSGKAVLATNLPTHTQILDSQVAMLAAPVPQAFAYGCCRLIEDGDLRATLGAAGKSLVEEKHSYAAFQEALNGLFDWLEVHHSRVPQVSRFSKI